MFCVISENLQIPRVGPDGIGKGNPALTGVHKVTCMPRVGEHIVIDRDGARRRFAVVKVTWTATYEEGLTGATVIVEDAGPV